VRPTPEQTQTKVRSWARQIKNQAQLEALLLGIPDQTERWALFQYLQPFLKFDAVFPAIPTFPNKPDVQPPGQVIIP
jgi:hypothetical protein